jgi:hypothetical protein
MLLQEQLILQKAKQMPGRWAEIAKAVGKPEDAVKKWWWVTPFAFHTMWGLSQEWLVVYASHSIFVVLRPF